MKTIKMIDLLNRCLEKDETLPNKTMYNDEIYYLSKGMFSFDYTNKYDISVFSLHDEVLIVDEVEILEEPKDITIQEIEDILGYKIKIVKESE